MSKDLIGYGQLVEDALRQVVRHSLTLAATDGLPGEHHFYLTFRTHHSGVVLPGHLKERFKDEMTIVLQHQFWNLQVEHEAFSLTLSFGGNHEDLVIPFPALTGFFDPSVQFGLQFQTVADDGQAGVTATPPIPIASAQDDVMPTIETGHAGNAGEDGANIVTLDTFRKK